MKPVWIKYYGIIPMTRWGYLIALACVGSVAVLFVIAVGAAGLLPPLSTLWQTDPAVNGPGFRPWFWNHMWHIILVCIVAQGIDTFMVLRRFAQKEAEQRAQLGAVPLEEKDIPYD
jgi:hypothetical protein